MTITELMQKYVVYVNDSRDTKALKQFIKANEPTFKFLRYGMSASMGYYWCSKEDGHLCFTPPYDACIPQRNVVLVKQLIAEYNEAQELAIKRLNDAINNYKKGAEKFNHPIFANLKTLLVDEAQNVAKKEQQPLTQIHIAFDDMTTHCIAKSKKGVVARSMAKAVGEDAENYDQLVGAIVAIAKLIPEEHRPELFDQVLNVMGIGIEMPTEAKLAYIDEK